MVHLRAVPLGLEDISRLGTATVAPPVRELTMAIISVTKTSGVLWRVTGAGNKRLVASLCSLLLMPNHRSAKLLA